MKKHIILASIVGIPTLLIILITLGFFKWIGVAYNSPLSLLWFIVVWLFIELVVTNITTAFFENLTEAYWFKGVENFIGLLVADLLVSSVSMNIGLILIISLVLLAIEILIDLLATSDATY